MTLEIFLRIAWVQIILSAIASVMSVIYFKRRSMEARLAGLTFSFGVITYICIAIIDPKGKNINIPQAIESIFYFLGVTTLFSVALRKRYRPLFFTAAILFTIFSILNLSFIQKNEVNTYSRVIGAMFIIVYGILYCYRLLIDLPAQHLQRVPMFWFNSGILIYNAGSLFLLLFAPYLVEVLHNDLLIYWSFHNIFNSIQTLIVMIGLWQDLRNTKSLSSSPSAP